MCPLVLRHWLPVVFGALLVASLLLIIQRAAACDVSDFEPYWPSVLKAYLTEDLSKNEGTPGQVRGIVPVDLLVRAELKNEFAKERLSTLVQDYPVLCQLKRLKPDQQQSHTLFITLVLQHELLSEALARKQISAKYLSDTAVANPHFTSNLIGHLSLLGNLIHTLEINREQLQYFTRIASAMVNDSHTNHKTLRVYSQAFGHLVLLINEGYQVSFIDYYSRMISTLKEDQFDQFLALDNHSTGGIEEFLSQIKQVGVVCHWLYLGAHNDYKALACGNKVYAAPLNRSVSF